MDGAAGAQKGVDDPVGTHHRQQNHQYRGRHGDPQAQPDNVPQLGAVLLAVFVADDRGDTLGIAKVHRRLNELNIEDDGDGGHAVLTGVVEHHQVEKHRGDGHRQVVDQLRGTVEAGAGQCPALPAGEDKAERALPVAEEVDDTKETRNGVSDAGGNGRTADVHPHRPQKEPIQQDVGHAACHGGGQSQYRLSLGDKEVLGEHLKVAQGQKEGEGEQIGLSIGLEHRRAAQQLKQLFVKQPDQPCNGCC